MALITFTMAMPPRESKPMIKLAMISPCPVLFAGIYS